MGNGLGHTTRVPIASEQEKIETNPTAPALRSGPLRKFIYFTSFS